MFEEQREILSKDEQQTIRFLNVGDKSNDPSIPSIELAATAVVASALFNFDETIIKR
jgi:hypothetical protein